MDFLYFFADCWQASLQVQNFVHLVKWEGGLGDVACANPNSVKDGQGLLPIRLSNCIPLAWESKM